MQATSSRLSGGWRVIAAILLLAGWAAAQPASGGPAANLIANPSLIESGADGQQVRDWTFESVRLVYGQQMGSASRDVRTSGPARHRVPEDGRGVLIEGTSDLARGDLVSAPFAIGPFRWVDVTVEYAVEAGDALALACLRPTADRSLVDLGFLPAVAPGETRRASLRLHTGRRDGDYSLSLSVVGSGLVRFLGVEAVPSGTYRAPDRPVVVIDLMRPEPLDQGPHGWDGIHKLVDVFGFSEVRFVHPLEVSRERLAAIDPALVVLSPTTEEMLAIDPATLDLDAYLGGVRLAAEFGRPVVGICAGHHVLCMAYGGRVGAVVEQGPDGLREIVEWGPTELDVVRDDPAFANLPRGRSFRAVEAHGAVVHSSFTMPENLASSDVCRLQVFRYPDRPIYTFQCHIEADWEYACPETQLIWKNLLSGWGLLDGDGPRGG
jgi:GMP synthase-like glutamine amidotransferase